MTFTKTFSKEAAIFLLAVLTASGIGLYHINKQGHQQTRQEKAEAERVHQNVVNLFLKAEYDPSIPHIQYCRIPSFNSVHQLQKKLRAAGVGIIRPWRTNENKWIYTTDYLPVGAAGTNGLPCNMALYLFSPSPDYIQEVNIRLNLGNPAEKQLALHTYAQKAMQLFTTIGLPVPPDLISALKTGSDYENVTEERTIRNAHESGQIESWTFHIIAH